MNFESQYCKLNLGEIFKITNKFDFFYKYFHWHTSYFINYGFKINNLNNNKKTAIIV